MALDKKDIIKKLQKFNQDLDEHVPKLDFESIKDDMIFKKDNSEFNEFMPFLANNINDLKTEMIIMRRTLTDNVESMVLRTLSEQQNQFTANSEKILQQFLVSLNNTFSTYLSEVSMELSSMKKEITAMKLENKKYTSKLDRFDTELLNFSSYLEEFKLSKLELKRMMDTGLNNFDQKIHTLYEDLDELKEGNVVLQKKYVSEIGNKMDLILAKNKHIESELKATAKDMCVFKKDLNILTHKKPEIILKKSDVPLSEIMVKRDLAVDLRNGAYDLNNETYYSDEYYIKNAPTVEKLLSIESRLKKLDSLK